jgi:hypothetical protein
VIDKQTLEEVIEILETPIRRPNIDDADEEECRACRRRWYVQGPKQTPPRHEEHCMLLILLAILSPLDHKPDSCHHWDGDGREVPCSDQSAPPAPAKPEVEFFREGSIGPTPCLDPDKMHGAGDGFPGDDYA